MFRVDFLAGSGLQDLGLQDLLAVQGTLKSLLQHRSSKASILQCSAFFKVQLSHPYMSTGKTSRVMSLLCNAMSGFLMAFQLNPHLLLIGWLLLSRFSTVVVKGGSALLLPVFIGVYVRCKGRVTVSPLLTSDHIVPVFH